MKSFHCICKQFTIEIFDSARENNRVMETSLKIASEL